jgi:hypothetical protein
MFICSLASIRYQFNDKLSTFRENTNANLPHGL